MGRILDIFTSTLWILSVLSVIIAQDDFAAISTTVTVSKSPAFPGEDVTISCAVTNLPAGYFIDWYKEVLDEQAKPLYETVSSSVFLKEPYKLNTRYSTRLDEENNLKTFHLDIKNVSSEDTGRYQCVVPEQEEFDAGTLVVLTPVKNLMFYNRTKGESVSFVEGDSIEVICISSGSIPAPQMSIHVGESDVSSSFTQSGQNTLMCGEPQFSGKSCLIHATHQQEMRSENFNPTHEDDGKELVCSSSVAQSDGRFPVEQVIMYLNVEHAPKIDCPTEKEVPRHSENVIIECSVYAKPELLKDGIEWSWLDGAQTRNLKPDDKWDDITSSRTISGKVNKISLVIETVYERHYREYTLNVENLLGSTSHTVTLKEMKKEDPGTGEVKDAGCAHLVLPSILLVIAFYLSRNLV